MPYKNYNHINILKEYARKISSGMKLAIKPVGLRRIGEAEN
jgi:hypothetical protein